MKSLTVFSALLNCCAFTMTDIIPSHTNEFYVTLPSNSSAQYFPDNKPGKYKTKLAYPLQLRGRWEVALSEIQYPRTWKNAQRNMMLTWSKKENGETATYTVRVLEGYYHTPEDVLSVIRSQLPENGIHIKYDSVIGKIRVGIV